MGLESRRTLLPRRCSHNHCKPGASGPGEGRRLLPRAEGGNFSFRRLDLHPPSAFRSASSLALSHWAPAPAPPPQAPPPPLELRPLPAGSRRSRRSEPGPGNSRSRRPGRSMGRFRGALRCIKYLLLGFNLLFWLAGSAVIAFGLWFRFGGTMKDFSSEDKSPEYFYMGLYVLVGAGVLMMAVGFFGCCGATRESQCVLGSFFTCLLVIFAAEVTTGVFAFIGKGVAIRHVQTMYEEAYNDYLRDREKGNGTLITFHSAFQCCGKESSEQVQPTCPKELLGHKNCIDEIETIISVKLQLVGIVGIGIAGLTIFGMIFSMVLCCAIRNSQDVI
uniref:Tetraspanin-2 n=1 Tax=Sus scrofa TaxID=9823 RepID=A0A8D1FLQ1_PIG